MTLDDTIFKDVFFGPNSNFNSPLTPDTKMLVSSFDGIHSGVPTRTTSTITPTTLRNIEQTFLELTSETPSTLPCQAGFVPPLPFFPAYEQESQDHSLGSTGSNSSGSWTTPPQSTGDLDSSVDAPPIKRKMGGRRPTSSSNLSPEEEEKRKVRRERNKLAAARCRKRRVDQTNELTDKVNQLEKDKDKLQHEIDDLRVVKEDLEFLLENHRSQCRISSSCSIGRKSPLQFKQPNSSVTTIEKIKTEPNDSVLDDDVIDAPPTKRILLTAANPIIGGVNNNASISNSVFNSINVNKPNRPSSLNVPLTMTPSHILANRSIADIAGIQVNTPSNGVMFNFDSLMDGGTGLTPVSQPLMPTCSTQNKTPLDLATPTSEPSKLVSL